MISIRVKDNQLLQIGDHLVSISITRSIAQNGRLCVDGGARVTRHDNIMKMLPGWEYVGEFRVQKGGRILHVRDAMDEECVQEARGTQRDRMGDRGEHETAAGNS